MLGLITVFPLIIIIYLFVKNRSSNRRWLAPFHSQHDFLSNCFVVFGVISAGQLCWQLFYIFVLRNNISSDSRLAIDLFLLIVLAISFFISYLGKSFHALTWSVIGFLFYWFYLMSSWTFENSSQIRPIYGIISSALVTCGIYLGTKWLEKHIYYLRFTYYLQFVLIGIIFTGLGIFSNYFIPKNTYLIGQDLSQGNIKMIISLIFSVLLFGIISIYSLGKNLISKTEFLGVLITMLLPFVLILSIFNTNSQMSTYTTNNDFSIFRVLFTSVSSLVFLLWPMLIIRRGLTDKVSWKKLYGILLLVLAVTIKVIELSFSGLLQSGSVFVLVGITLLVSAIFLQMRQKKLKTS